MEKGPLWLSVGTESTILICEMKTCNAAAVVNPPTSGSDRYRTRKPTCNKPMATWEKINFW